MTTMVNLPYIYHILVGSIILVTFLFHIFVKHTNTKDTMIQYDGYSLTEVDGMWDVTQKDTPLVSGISLPNAMIRIASHLAQERTKGIAYSFQAYMTEFNRITDDMKKKKLL